MLKRVFVFLSGIMPPIGLEKLEYNLTEHEVEVFVSYKQELESVLHTIEKQERQELLLITDDSDFCTYFIKKGFYVLAYLSQNCGNLGSAKYAIEGFEEVDFSYLEFIYKRYARIPITILETKRCLIREIEIADVDALYEIYKEPSITKYMENLFEDREQEKAYTKDYIENIYTFYGYGMWVVIHKETGKLIGRVGLELRADVEGVELGFVIERTYQKKGYAFETCSAILEYAEKELGFESVHCFVRKENRASVSLCKKLGFVYKQTRKIEEEIYEEYEWAPICPSSSPSKKQNEQV